MGSLSSRLSLHDYPKTLCTLTSAFEVEPGRLFLSVVKVLSAIRPVLNLAPMANENASGDVQKVLPWLLFTTESDNRDLLCGVLV